ncbi:MAG: DUF4147 domain-containing protein [Fimbriimonadaceae bacterium]|nr:DUF4147 domain-containing protein [Fimbriimonadaceae bacterium]
MTRDDLLDIARSALAATEAGALLRRAVSRDGDRLRFGGRSYDLWGFDRVLVVAAGKAAGAMVVALEPLLEGMAFGGVAVTKAGHAPVAPTRSRFLIGGHPVPDEGSVAAGRAVRKLLAGATARTFVIGLISGGASALLEDLRPGVSLESLRLANRALLGSGAPIQAINRVRARLSTIKAGGLLEATGEAEVVVAVLSDVLGDDLAAIGSGPFVPVRGDGSAEEALRQYRVDLGFALPPARARAPRETPPHVVIGNLETLLAAAEGRARELGLAPSRASFPLVGEASSLPPRLLSGGRGLLIAGGEPTVTLGEDFGWGGRMQEFALAAAPLLEGTESLVLAAGSDGTDGPTDAAGALVDGGTVGRIRAAGLDPLACLRRHDAYPALRASGDLLFTGPTGTNVGDLVLAFRAS